MRGFVDHIEKRTQENENFRRVLYTAKQMQLVLMALPAGEEIGEEVHRDRDQFFRVESGSGEIWIDGLGARWDRGWTALYTLCCCRAAIFTRGDISELQGATKSITSPNGTAARWSALGSGLNGHVYALALSSCVLYAGGLFSYKVAKWNGNSWSALGLGINGTAYALATSGTDLYAGGSFTSAGGIAATNIARWNGGGWSALGSGLNGTVYALAVSGGDVYAAGSFLRAGDITAYGVAKWNGSSWSALGSGLNGYVYGLAVSGGDVYAGGANT